MCDLIGLGLELVALTLKLTTVGVQFGAFRVELGGAFVEDLAAVGTVGLFDLLG